MRQKRVLCTLVGALLLGVPIATANWASHGSLEPDTSYDRQDGWMFEDPDTSADQANRQVYFNVFPTNYATGVNVNAGTLGTQIRQFNLVHFQAVLGVWKDCNGDGYIGLAESAIDVYRAELLPENHPCPVDTENVDAHNDGEWVWEFIHIGPTPADVANDTTSPMIMDDDVAVWGDIGRPGRIPGTSCPLAPLPHGTTAGTGAFIRWADCLANYRITDTVNAIDADGSLGLAFKCDGMSDEECQNNPQKSNSLLNQELPESLFGNPREKETGTLQKDPENEGEAAFTTWDCTKRGQQVRDPTGEEGERGSLSNWTVRDPTDGNLTEVFGEDNELRVNLSDEEGVYAWTATPAPTVNDPTWSVAAGLNNTADGFGGETVAEGCDDGNTYDGTHATVFFYADGDFEGTAQAPGKNQADSDFSFFNGGNGEESVLNETVTTGNRTPVHPGGIVIGPGGWFTRPGWDAGNIWVYYFPQTLDDTTFNPDGGDWWTFYARVGDAAIAAHGLGLPKGPSTKGTYGSLNCGNIGPGAANEKGWVCDPDQWYLDPQGKDISEPQMQRVGALYNLMDVDCFDGRLTADGAAYASLAPLSEDGVCE